MLSLTSLTTSALIALILAAPLPASAASASKAPIDPAKVQMERDFKRLNIPTGKVDGVIDGLSLRALCVWRELTNRTASRAPATQADMQAIATTQTLTVPAARKPGLNINITCQSAILIDAKQEAKLRIMQVSTGRSGAETSRGSFKVGWLIDDWYQSHQFPDGWMFRPQFFHKGQAIHGSMNDLMVHSYPASHGCVRMKRADINYLWATGFGRGSTINVYGTWKG